MDVSLKFKYKKSTAILWFESHIWNVHTNIIIKIRSNPELMARVYELLNLQFVDLDR